MILAIFNASGAVYAVLFLIDDRLRRFCLIVAILFLYVILSKITKLHEKEVFIQHRSFL